MNVLDKYNQHAMVTISVVCLIVALFVALTAYTLTFHFDITDQGLHLYLYQNSYDVEARPLVNSNIVLNTLFKLVGGGLFELRLAALICSLICWLLFFPR